MASLKGKVAIVTGASKGIGAEIARALGAAGAAVGVNYASDEQGAQRVVADIVRADGRALALQGDVAKRATWFACSPKLGGRSGPSMCS